MRRFRKMTWVLLAWTVLIIVWAGFAATGTDESVEDCLRDSGGLLTRQDCEDAAEAGAGLGVFLILLLGFVGFLALAAVWFASQPRGRSEKETARIVAEALRQQREEEARRS